MIKSAHIKHFAILSEIWMAMSNLDLSLTSKLHYCKRGYFHWGKISRKCWQDISCGGNFHDTTHISFIKAYGFYFRVGVIFAKKTKLRKTRKLPPSENFHSLQKLFK